MHQKDDPNRVTADESVRGAGSLLPAKGAWGLAGMDQREAMESRPKWTHPRGNFHRRIWPTSDRSLEGSRKVVESHRPDWTETGRRHLPHL